MNLRRLFVAASLFALAALSVLTFPSPSPRPAEASNVTEIAAGQLHACALTGSGSVKCWGDNTNGQLGDGTTSQRNTPVDVCASGTWNGSACSGSVLTGIVHITAGASHTCAVTASSGAKCWGRNDVGQLGDGTTTERHNPVDVCGTTGTGATCSGGSVLAGVLRVSAGSVHTCALMSGGGVKCWGDNSFNQLGDGTASERDNPVDVCATGSWSVTACSGSALTGVNYATAGQVHTCALMAGGGVKCWGRNASGQLGDGNFPNDSANPVNVCAVVGCPSLLSGASYVDAGGPQTCAVLSGGAVCWGYNGFGQLGNGNAGVDSDIPVNVCANSTCSANLSGVIFVATNGYTSCASITGNRVTCWGSNNLGQLSNGDEPNNSDTPVDACAAPCSAPATDVPAAGGDVGDEFGCAPTTTGNVRCAGWNDNGQLGDGQACGSSCDAAVNVTGLSSKTPANTITAPDTTGSVGTYTALALDASGYPVVSYNDTTNTDVKVLHCGNAACSSGNVTTAPDTAASATFGTSIVLDASGRPVVAYPDLTTGAYSLKLLHCGNATCTAGNSIQAIDASATLSEGLTEIVLDAVGNPVVGYGRTTAVPSTVEGRILHCGDANCSSGNSIVATDTGLNTSSWLTPQGLVLDGLGIPIAAYQGNGQLRVEKCGDVNCIAGTITPVDTAGTVGRSAALALDVAGNPVVSYWDTTNAALKVLHCGNDTCTSGNTFTTPFVAGSGSDGSATSIRLDSLGRPIVAFYDPIAQTLAVLHCGDANCAANNTIGRPDTGSGNVGQFPSMQLDAAGNPVVSYYDVTNGNLKVLHCANPTCSGTETVPVSAVTGTGSAGDSGSGVSASTAAISGPTGLSQSATALYFADTQNCKVKKIESGISTTLAGAGSGGGPTNCGFSSDGTASGAKLNLPRDVFLQGSDLYIADTENCRIRKISGSSISTVAGTGTCGFSDGAVATAKLGRPRGVAVDGSGNIYIADTQNCRIRKVSGGNVTTIAGSSCGYGGDNGPATSAQLNNPGDIAFLLPGSDLVIADTGNNRIRRYSMANGMIITIAGTGNATYNGDDIQATSANLSAPAAVTAFDSRVLIADTGNNRIRRVDVPTGVIETLVGQGGETGSYVLSAPEGVSLVASGGGGAGAAAGSGQTASDPGIGPDGAFSNTAAQSIGGIAGGTPPNRGNFRPATSCSVTPHISSIDFALLPTLLGLVGFRRRLRVLFVTLLSALRPHRRSPAAAA